MSTEFLTKKDAEASRKWFVVDAESKVVGRLASQVAEVLRGKRNPQYTAHQDSGDFVVVINADKVAFTGNKIQAKKYFNHSGYIGGITEETAGELLARKPEEVIKRAVKGMLPKNALGRAQLKKLKIYAGAEHPHFAQQPVELSIK